MLDNKTKKELSCVHISLLKGKNVSIHNHNELTIESQTEKNRAGLSTCVLTSYDVRQAPMVTWE